MQKRFNPGPAARNGVASALLAQMGFTGAETILEGERGFLKAFSDRYDLSKLVEGLGEAFPIFIEYKPYACARPIHNAIDCALEVKKQTPIDPAQIASITVSRHPRWANYHQINKPRTYHEAQVSLPYAVAVSLIEGKAFLGQYSEEKLKDPMIQQLSRLVKIQMVEGLPRDVSCRMEVLLKSGETYTSQVDYPKGSIQNPMNDAERWDKFQQLSENILDEDKQKSVRDMVLAMEKVTDVSELLTLLVGKE